MRMYLYIPPEIVEKLQEIAERDYRPLKNQLLFCIVKYLEKEENFKYVGEIFNSD